MWIPSEQIFWIRSCRYLAVSLPHGAVSWSLAFPVYTHLFFCVRMQQSQGFS